MKIALIGYGKMGRAIEKVALERGHEITARIDMNGSDRFDCREFVSSDVAIEFTQPHAAMSNIRKAWDVNVPVVCGTTGWVEHLDEMIGEAVERNQTLFWASNFSLGVNVFFEFNRQLAAMMNGLSAYNVSMTEIHHIHKKDAPSGTAISLANDLIKGIDRKSKWALAPTDGGADTISIDAQRIDEVNGTHTVKYSSAMDCISITHEAHSREGFALGAVIAAEFVAGKKGFYSMADLLKILIGR